LLKSYRADRAQFAAALNVAVFALTTSLLMWLVAFLDVGGEWFLMWQSKMWNGHEEEECGKNAGKECGGKRMRGQTGVAPFLLPIWEHDNFPVKLLRRFPP